MSSELTSVEQQLELELSHSSLDTELNKSLEDFCKGLVAPSKDNLLRGCVPIPEWEKDDILLFFSVISTLLFKM